MKANQIKLNMRLLIFTLLLTSSPAWAVDKFAGAWQLNLEESDKVAIRYEDGSGAGNAKIFNNMSVNVGGLPLPTLNRRTPAQSRMAPKSPDVLLCNQMTIDPAKDRITVVYDENKKEQLRKGHYRGRDSKWNRKLIEQKYKTPDRKVTKTWTIRPDGRLLVEVKLNPPKDRSRTYRRVFDRVAVTQSAAANGDATSP